MTTVTTLCSSLLLTLLAIGAVHAADQAVWLEGEAPAGGAIAAPWSAASADHAGYLSGGKWLELNIGPAEAEKSIPDAGLTTGWDFQIATAGHFHIWERYGFESIRCPFSWRIDAQDWQDIPVRTQPYTDLMDAGVWCELSWMQLGEADLATGAHHLEVRIQRQYDAAKKPQHLLQAIDCFCIATSFAPDGKHQPGEDWRTENDKKAAALIFPVTAGSGDEHAVVPLSGLWQVARFDEFEPADRSGPDPTLPAADQLIWSAIPVPGNKYQSRPDLNLAHRLVYRARLQVPAGLAGHSFVLHCPAINMIASVHVNGHFCGWTKGMFSDWDIDLTPAITPGSVNELEVVIKDTYYSLSPQKAKQPWSRLAFTPVSVLRNNWIGQYMDFPVNSVPESGILAAPTLIVGGGVFSSDVFAKPSVATKALALEVTLKNPGTAPADATLTVSIEPAAGGAPEKVFAAKQVTLPPSSEQMVELSEGWENPRLWWPDSPQLYSVVTRVSVAGRPVDVRRTTFGFREWGWATDQITLNGIPWHFHADTSDMNGTPDQRLAYLRSHNQNMVRMWQWRFWGMNQQEALDYFDRTGMVVRHTSIFDGEGGNYLHGLADQKLFDNWTEYLKSWCRAERNHPSLLIWSIENEITFINSRNFGMSATVEPMVAKGAKAVMAMDPTRPVMVDGGRCLISEELPVNGCHYDESDWRDYPEEAYTYERAFKSHKTRWNVWDRSPWRLVPGRPIFHGESFYYVGNRPADLAQWGGEQAFVGWNGARAGGTLFAKILSEGNRWFGVAAFDFSLTGDQVDNYYNSWKPVIALVREWNWTFAGGQPVERTVKVLNDTRLSDPIELDWSFSAAGRQVAAGSKTFTIPPGTAQQTVLDFTPPAVSARTPGELVLSCKRGGEEVFHDAKPIWLIDADGGPKPAFRPGELAVLDPQGAVIARLKSRGIAFSEITSAQDLPAGARVVVVGPDALDPLAATGNQWLAVAARGGRVLVLDQKNPLQAAAIPADMAPTAFTGRVAFAENLTHPILAGLDQPDFFTWSKDEVVYRNVYSKPSRGATSLAQCDLALGYTALAESHVNDGLMVMCQLVVGSKLASDPVAQRLFDNMLGYCADYQPVRKVTAVVLDETSPRAKILAEGGLVYEKAGDPLAAVKSGRDQIVVFDASPANLKSLVADLPAVQAFTAKGGWLFAWGLTQEGLGDFNTLVGVQHLLRPFRRERVTLPAVRDPLLSGLTMRDVVMDSGEQVAFWNGMHYAATDSFCGVVDFDDIAPFCAYPPWQYFNPGKDKPDPDKDPYNLVNGFVNSDDWRFILQLPAKPPFLEWDVTLPRAEELAQFDIINNGNYRLLDRIELTLDDDKDHPVVIPIKTVKDVIQSFPLPARTASRIHVKLASWEEKQGGAVIGIDNWWIRVKRSPEFYAKVKPLLNIGALMKYEQGAGGVVLCELNIPEREQNPENGPKRRTLVGTLLRNLGAVYSGGRTIAAGANLAYQPIPLGDLCNLFLTRDKGWFDDERHDLVQFPAGENAFAAVTYQVRDVKTSPLPNAISLAGARSKTTLPAAVSGIPVGRKADALFFLHTCKQTRNWQAPGQGDKTPPTLWSYVVHYDDGQSAVVPVRLGQGVANWLQRQPVGLAAAVVAWTAPLPDVPEQATVYQMEWTNPRPDAAIATIDVTTDPQAKATYGVPVVIAITAATASK